MGFPDGSEVKNPPANTGDTLRMFLFRDDPACCGHM